MNRAILAAAFAYTAAAQSPVPPAKRLPPAGIEISAPDRTELVAGVAALGGDLERLRKSLTRSDLIRLVPDVEIFHKAVDWALRYDEFFDPKQVEIARTLLSEGRERARQLRAGNAPWLHATGLVIRGYQSTLDRSIQPFALVIPAAWAPGDRTARRLDVVLPGRNEKRTELAFIAEHQKSPGEIVPAGTIVLHPYGRFCNATKFAGEVDVFEAMGHVRSHYSIDPDRIVVRGFSMGGASTWHLAAHHSGVWCAASPGAGFAETALYTQALGPGKEPRTSWEQTLWRWYDAAAYAANFANCPTVAYSGELDPQKQAADVMERALASEGLALEHLIGPQTAHKYHPETRERLAERLAALAAKGRDPMPRAVHVTTFTLRYAEVAWVRIEGLVRHWERADVHAERTSDTRAQIQTRNVTAMALSLPQLRELFIDGQDVGVPAGVPSGIVKLLRVEGVWQLGESSRDDLRKRIGSTGPIDDAFMNAFVFVRPTHRPYHARVGSWVQGELTHATRQWRSLFRGDAPVIDDQDLSTADIAKRNLVLWGDPSSNRVLAKIISKLPLKWNSTALEFRGKRYDAASHAAVLVFPNPLSPARYIVLNSGIDFRDEGYGTNALQTPKLPDWAIVDLDEPPGPRWAGAIVEAGFFDEDWKP